MQINYVPRTDKDPLVVRRPCGEHVDPQARDVLVCAITERSDLLGVHVTNVGALGVAVANVLHLSDQAVACTRLAAELHDVGKLAIPDALLNKPAPLDDYEWSLIHRHTIIGERILAAAPALSHIAPLVRSTHERVDGTGYPDQLRNVAIPLVARLVTVVDAYDAMTSYRPYRSALSTEDAIGELRSHSGSQFDPTITEALISVIRSSDHNSATGSRLRHQRNVRLAAAFNES